jgi:hypothetical protein
MLPMLMLLPPAIDSATSATHKPESTARNGERAEQVLSRANERDLSQLSGVLGGALARLSPVGD